MSITFSAPNTPEVLVDTFECQCAYDGTASPDCWECNGTGKVTFHEPLGSFNVHNAGGAALCRLLGLEQICGHVDAVNFPKVRQAILRARNSARSRSTHTFEGYELPGGHAGVRTFEDEDGCTRIQRMGARVISGGIDDASLLRRLDLLEELLKTAEEFGSEYISWG